MGTGLLPYHVGLDTDSQGVQACIRMCLYTSRVTCQYQYSHTCGCLTTCNNNSMKSTKVLNPRRCIMRVYTREMRMRVHENTHGKMADCMHGRTTEGVLDLCNGVVSEKTPQIF